MPFRKKSSVVKNGFIPTQDIKSSKQLSNNDKVCGGFLEFGIKGYEFKKGSMTNTGCEVKPVCCNFSDKLNRKVNCVTKIDEETISENSTKTLLGFLNEQGIRSGDSVNDQSLFDIKGCFQDEIGTNKNVLITSWQSGDVSTCNLVDNPKLGTATVNQGDAGYCNNAQKIYFDYQRTGDDNKYKTITAQIYNCKVKNTNAPAAWCTGTQLGTQKTITLVDK